MLGILIGIDRPDSLRGGLCKILVYTPLHRAGDIRISTGKYWAKDLLATRRPESGDCDIMLVFSQRKYLLRMRKAVHSRSSRSELPSLRPSCLTFRLSSLDLLVQIRSTNPGHRLDSFVGRVE